MKRRARLIIVLALAVTCLLASNLESVHAQPSHSTGKQRVFSVNTITNPGFEQVIPGTNQPSGWRADYTDSNVGSTVSANSTLSHSGDYSARMDIAQNQSSASTGNPITFGEIRLIQTLPPNTLVSNLTNRPDGLNLWFYIQPKFAGFTLLQVKVIVTDTTTLDYELGNPTLGISFSNSTDGGEAGRPVKQIVLPPPSLNQWNNLARNLKHDWLAPMTLPNGTSVSGMFQENATIFLIELDAFFFRDLSGATYGETAWIDDVAVYLNTPTPPGHRFDNDCQSVLSNRFEPQQPSLNLDCDDN